MFQISCLLSSVSNVHNAPLFLAKGGMGGNQIEFPPFSPIQN